MKGNIFIKRPVMAFSISVLILVIGLISLFTLPVEQYPDIAPPTVYVSANYTGADAEAVLNSVIMPLEESINGVESMMYISSTATNAGSATIQVYFKQGTDPDMAAVNVQNRVAKAQGLLPAEVTKIGVTTQKRQTSFLQIGALVSTDGRYNQTFLANYLDINVIPQIKRIEGVGDVMELGDTYSMRIWLKPERMAQYGLVPSDVTAVLGEQNIEAPTGSLGGSAGWINSAGSMIVNPGKFLASAVGSLTQSLFARGQVIAQYRIARARQEEASLVFRQTLLNAQLAQTANRFSEIQSLINLYKALGGGQE
jgi:multidrug efflux pump subunit AcrB